jgi:hypothetical protein
MKQTESMTKLVARYRRQWAAFNRLRPLPNETWNRMADDSFRQMQHMIRRAPIKTKEDAVAALNYIERVLAEVGKDQKALTPILRSLRGFIHKERVLQRP